MPYDPASVVAYFDHFGSAEWDRFDRSLGDRVSFMLHAEALERAVPRGSRVLEMGPGRVASPRFSIAIAAPPSAARDRRLCALLLNPRRWIKTERRLDTGTRRSTT